MTETFKKFCGLLNGSFDAGFTLLPKEDCYQIDWHEWKKFFQEKSANEVQERSENSHLIHIWNKLSHDEIISENLLFYKLC